MKNFTLTLLIAVFISGSTFAQEGYIKGDFHQHTTFTDGSFNINHVMEKNNAFGLDWWANSEHGGSFNRDGRTSDETTTTYWSEDENVTILGDQTGEAPNYKMWRWQMLRDFSFPEILDARSTYNDRTIIQGYEMNVPGHEHGSVAILGEQFNNDPNVNALAQFEYMFDNNDGDQTGGAAQGWVKSSLSGHEKTLEALTWLQANHRKSSYLIPAHPERKKLYSIADFRDMNTTAPDVCFGFESMPGHQKNDNRGGYKTTADGGGTYGGTGVYAAKIGGLWDAMLSEGRNWWLFASSDFHSEGDDFYPGEYQKTYTYLKDKSDAKAIINGLRSGNSWIVTGDLIDELNFTVSDARSGATMGQTLKTLDQNVTITIIVNDPDGTNFNTYTAYNSPELDHIDLVAGVVSDKLNPSDENYNTPEVSTTQVIARFDANGGVIDGNGLTSIAWEDLGNGRKKITYQLAISSNMYFRLRGTNKGLNEANETDANGNPLLDFESSLNGAEEAFDDLWFYSNPVFVKQIAQSGYLKGDFHQHTTFTDGSFNIDHVMAKNNEFGLDWWANSEHGGAFNRDGRTSDENNTYYWTEDASVVLKGNQTGNDPYYSMWRWQMIQDYSFPEILDARNTYGDKVIVQGYEMNVPGHEHGSVAILGEQFSQTPNVNALSQFEFMFDNSDGDQTGGANMGWTKSSASGHAKTLEAISWLQSNHQHDSYLVPAHPERKSKYTVADFRDMNNAGPDVCFGFESMSGHQKSGNRGGYSTTADGGGTYGGTGIYAAKVGGLWDALLSEGRGWWLFASSDFHNEGGDFYPGEYQKTYTYVEDRTSAQSIINGLRSGNSWIVTGDLIDELLFTVKDDASSAEMGQTLNTTDETINVSIVVNDPEGFNNNVYTAYNAPELDHIDLIAGVVSGKIDPSSEDYNTAEVATTHVIARFDAVGGITDGNGITSIAWTDLGNGRKQIDYTLDVDGDMYLRLRGSNKGLDEENEMDENGNPILDFESSMDGAEEAFDDLWFYSNPVFIATTPTAIDKDPIRTSAITIAPNPTNGFINIANMNDDFKTITIYNMSGAVVKTISTNNNTCSIDLSNLSKGIYFVMINETTGKTTQKIIRQ
nr:T9SS type A sorting domain-containing protein [uncultured Carboxylicivirga sp.]